MISKSYIERVFWYFYIHRFCYVSRYTLTSRYIVNLMDLEKSKHLIILEGVTIISMYQICPK